MSSYAILTNTGRNKEAAALANGTALNIAEIAWGDGDYAPSGGETALENEVGRKPVQGQGTVVTALNTVFFEILLTEAEGPFVIHEAGLFDDDGDLIAIVKYDPPVNKPKDTVSALLRINVVFSDLENLIVQIDATTAFIPATRRVNTGDGLSGGGQLDKDLTISPVIPTQAEAELGANNTKLMTPLRVKQAITSLAPTQSNAEMLTALKTVDGSGSGLDADLLDGHDASYFVPTSRSVSAGTGLTGGGNLGANRTLSVGFASQAEALAGASTTKVMNALRTKQAIGHMIKGSILTSSDDLNDISDGFYSWVNSNPANSPTLYGSVYQTSLSGQPTQILFGSYDNKIGTRRRNNGVWPSFTIMANKGDAVGANQSWSRVTRTSGTAYQNTSGKPIMVSITRFRGGTIQVSSNGSTWVTAFDGPNFNDYEQSVSLLIPDDHFYKVTGNLVATAFMELK